MKQPAVQYSTKLSITASKELNEECSFVVREKSETLMKDKWHKVRDAGTETR